VLNPLRLRRIRASGVPARAYPLDVMWASGETGSSGDRHGEPSWIGGQATVLWRVERDGHAPYEVQDTISAPGWAMPGRRGKRLLSVRWRPGRGLDAELGLPCRIDPDDPAGIAIDWDAGYDEHARRWDELDADLRHVSRRRGGLDSALDRVHLRGAPAPTPERAAELDRLVDEQAAADRGAEEAAFTPLAPVAAQMGERETIAAQMAEARRLRKLGVKVAARIVSCEDTGQRLLGLPVWRICGELDDPSGIRRAEQLVAMPERSTRKLDPGREVNAFSDPDYPAKVTFF
jgi:hypothetical protein